MIVNPNIIGGGYFALVSFLWIVAGWDYESRIYRNKIRDGIIISRKLHLRLAFFLLWFMAAFRGLDVTNDTAAYYRTYLRINSFGFAGELRMEIGYVALNVLLTKIFNDPDAGFHMLLFLTSTLSYFAVEQWIEKHANSYGVCILAFYFLQNSSCMSPIRQSIAMAIVLLVLTKLENKKYVVFILGVFTATLFHASAIVSLLFVLLYNKKYKITWVISLLLLVAITTATNLVSGIIYFVNYGTRYTVNEVRNLLSVVAMSVLYIILLLLRCLASKEFIVKDKDTYTYTIISNDFYNYCIVISFFLTIMSLRVPALSRMSSYFTITGLPYISNVMFNIRNQIEAFLIKVFFCLAIWAWSVVVLIYRPEWQHLWPYNFWWSTN